METLIKKLIEIDKNARKQVEAAERKKDEAVDEIKEIKKQLSEKAEQQYKAALVKAKKNAEERIENEYSKEKISRENLLITEKMDALYFEKKEAWVAEIFEKVTG